MIYSGIILRCDVMYVYNENENIENGLNPLFFNLKMYLPFSFVQLGMVSVHSGSSFCTFRFIFVQKVRQFVHLVYTFVQLLFCTVGSICCTFSLYFCTLALLFCTFGYFICTNGGIL